MSRNEIESAVGKFGEIAYQGRFYPSKVTGFIREIEGDRVRIQRLEGSDIWVVWKGMTFTPRRLKKELKHLERNG